MLYLIPSIALAAEPSSLGSPPPSGADLERVEEGWRFTRPVEVEGHIVSETGLTTDGHISTLTWSASGPAADVLANWHKQRSPENGCVGPRDRWVGVRDGVIYQRTTKAVGGEWRLTAEETLDPAASCDRFAPPKPKLPAAAPPAPLTPKAPTLAPKPPPLAVPAAVPRSIRPQVASDPAPEIAGQIRIESTDLSEVPIKRIAGWCLAEHPGSGVFHWEADRGTWRLVKGEQRSPESGRLASCMDAMLAPMPARGAITISIGP